MSIAAEDRIVIPQSEAEFTKAVESAVSDIEKEYGKGAIQRLGQRVGQKVPCIPTGIPSIDNHVLGIGGFARGRVIEIFGPEAGGKTTLALRAIAEAQKAKGLAAFIDAEHAFGPTWAKLNGVDVDNLLVSQPDCGEEGLEIADRLIRSGAFSIIVIDSVAALVPKSELEGDMGQSFMGVHARLMSQALRKLTGIVSKSNTCLIFINQIREKIGVMFGCFSYNSRVVLADGSTEKIGKIVNQKLNVKVLSMNPETGAISAKQITEWHDNGNTDNFIRVVTTNGLGRGGKSSMAVTPNHMVFTPTGETQAKDLKVGAKVLGLGKITFSETQLKVAIGSILGDGNLRPTGKHNVTLRIRHGAKQKQYAEHKAKLYSNMLVDVGYASNGSWGFQTAPSSDLYNLYEKCYEQGGKRHLHEDLLNNLSLHGLAIWYMDDGNFSGSYKKWGNGKSCISAKTYSDVALNRLADTVMKLGVPRPKIEARGRLMWYGEDSLKLHTAIASFVPECMQYKLHPSVRDRFIQPEADYIAPKLVTVETIITKIEPAKPTRSKTRFDLSVEGNHTYFVDGIAVHNSPETTTGGRALKFYSSVRLDVRRIGQIKDGDEIIGAKVRIKGAKNKLDSPFKEAEVDLLFDRGFDPVGNVLDVAVEHGIVSKAGAWYTYKTERIGQGRANTVQFLIDNPAIYDRIYKELNGVG